ncbi:MAG: hypothetical protein HOO06_13655 [Bdellovibrionaceae bacterium]|nr:hypothetical protein [Pseudobdellovibrionaceae bacterium]
MNIQKRDLEILFALSKYGVFSTGQIGSKYFMNVERSTVLRRLRILKTHGLILNPSTLENGMKVWSVSKMGAELIGAEVPFRYSNRNTALHDVTLSQLRQHLETLITAKNWVSDMQFRRKLAQTGELDSTVPDGMFNTDIFQEPTRVALELELHPKAHQRYKKVFYDYKFHREVTYIFYVVKHFSILKPVFKIWGNNVLREGRFYKQRIIGVVFQDLLEHGLEAKIHWPNGLSAPLKKLFN